MTHKITAIEPQDTWTGNDGKANYDSLVTLDNNKSARVSAKSPDRWKVGDEVEIKSERPGRHGLKWSLVPPGFDASNNSGNATAKADSVPDIEAGWAIKSAIQWNNNASIDDIKKRATELLKLKTIIATQIKNKEI